MMVFIKTNLILTTEIYYLMFKYYSMVSKLILKMIKLLMFNNVGRFYLCEIVILIIMK